jgi:hypothetical protein
MRINMRFIVYTSLDIISAIDEKYSIKESDISC